MSVDNTTSIVNLRFHKADVYCGRGSIFGNPFNHERLGITRDEACDRFEEYFRKKLHDERFRASVRSLKGKKLGCWCQCNPPCNNSKCKSYRCHVETIVRYLSE